MAKVKLISWTNKPIETIYFGFMNMHNKIPDNLDEISLSEQDKEEFIAMLTKQPHQTVFEFVNTVWYIEGASRAFQQQLTRSRNAAYSIQSLRIVNVGNFADEKRYTMSSKIMNNPEALAMYEDCMYGLQETYKQLIALGCPVEDARGILPLNIHSTITMAVNLRDLYHMLELRFCDNTQEEFREIAAQIREEVKSKMHPLLASPMKPMCFETKICPSPVPCNKYGFKNKEFGDIRKWIKG